MSYSSSIAPEKYKALIFTRRRYLPPLNVYLDNSTIPYVSDVSYLGISFDSKLRWVPHMSSLTKFLTCWSNFLRSVAGIWWGSHPSSLISIYFSIIRSKLDYGCFLFGSASSSNMNKLQSSCLRTIMGYLRSTPSPAIEVETVREQ